MRFNNNQREKNKLLNDDLFYYLAFAEEPNQEKFKQGGFNGWK